MVGVNFRQRADVNLYMPIPLNFPGRAVYVLLRSLVLIGALLQTTAYAQNGALEVITLKYRTAEQVMPV